MPRFSANLSLLFGEVPFLERFSSAARAGFTAVELHFPYQWPAAELARHAKEAGLRIVHFNLPAGDWDRGERGLAAVPGREREFRDALYRGLDYATILGCRQLHMMAGIVPKGSESKRIESLYFENLCMAASEAEAADIHLLLEPIASQDTPGYFLKSTSQARSLIKAAARQNVGLQLDLYHTQLSEGRLTPTLSAQIDILRHVQISGVPGRHEPDAEQEINYAFLLRHLDNLGYQGWVGCEYRPRADTLSGLRWAEGFGLLRRS